MNNRFQHSLWIFGATFTSLFKLPYLKYFGCCDWSKNNSVSIVNSSEIENRKTARDSAAWAKQDKKKKISCRMLKKYKRKSVFWLEVP